MAAFRGAKASADQLNLYAQRILRDIPEKFGLVDAISAAEAIADLERGEGELAFPEIGAVLKMCEVQQVARMHRESLQKNKALVVWICETCGYRKSGFLNALDSAYRTCPSHWGPLLPFDAPRVNGQRPKRVQLTGGQVCGRELTIQTDERSTA